MIALSRIRFRVVSDRAREEIYLRGHKSGSPDALQYTPAFQGVGNWQIYHGEGYTAAAAFAHDEWCTFDWSLKARGQRYSLEKQRARSSSFHSWPADRAPGPSSCGATFRAPA